MQFRSLQMEVSDLNQANAFYSRLLGIPGKFDRDVYFFDFAGGRILLMKPRKDYMKPHPQTGVSFDIADFDEALARGEELAKALEDVGEFRFSGLVGMIMFSVTDVDGNNLTFFRQGA